MKFFARIRAAHVTAISPNVRGEGQWATLPDGTIIGRIKVGERMYCDVCADDPDRPVRLSLLQRP